MPLGCCCAVTFVSSKVAINVSGTRIPNAARIEEISGCAMKATLRFPNFFNEVSRDCGLCRVVRRSIEVAR